ncbi:MAG: DUF5681 domain-containing protein [Candidatus Omnitrophota bacterium]
MNDQNLKPFKKGESGNPNGRPKGARSLSNLLREALQKIGEGNQEPYDILLIKRVMKMAIADGNEQMVKLVWSYMDGMPVQKTETDITTKGESVISLSAEVIALAEEQLKKKKLSDDGE